MNYRQGIALLLFFPSILTTSYSRGIALLLLLSLLTSSSSHGEILPRPGSPLTSSSHQPIYLLVSTPLLLLPLLLLSLHLS